jgi:hypothetical protein
VACTFALYEVVRRFAVVRFLFGMRPKKRLRAGEAAAVEAGAATRPSAVSAVRAR